MAVRHDLHTHTTWSDGSRTVEEQLLLARAQELEAVAITDHCFPGQRLAAPGALDRYVAHIDEAARAEPGELLVLAGVEATILDVAGHISLGERDAGALDWVLCDLSHLSSGTLADTPSSPRALAANVLRSYHAVCDIPYVDCIAHPFNTGRLSPPLLPESFGRGELEELAGHMAATGTVFDVMNLTVLWFRETGVPSRAVTEQYVGLVRVFALAGVRFQLSSDDHRSGLGNTRWSELVIARADVPEQQIIGTRELRDRSRSGRTAGPAVI